MSDLETVFEVLLSAGLVKNTEEYSTRFLKRSPSYFRMARSTGSNSLSAIATLSSRLHQTANALKESNVGNTGGPADDLSQLSDQLWHKVYSRSLEGSKLKS